MPPKKFNKGDRILWIQYDAPGTVTQVKGHSQYRIRLDTPVYAGQLVYQNPVVFTWEIEKL
jgi:hypothetical protein